MRWLAIYGRLFTLFAALLLTIRVTTMGLRVRRMRLTLSFLIATAISGLALQPALASDRYREAPPLLVSPDLSAPWVIQLQRAPQGRPVHRAESRRQPQPAPALRARVAPDPVVRPRATPKPNVVARERKPDEVQTAALPSAPRDIPKPREIDPKFLPQVVDYNGPHAPGTIVIDTREHFLYLVEEGGKARRYGVGTGKPGFEWAGTHKVTRKAEWPDWRPPAEMIAREKKKGRILPTFVKGGLENPLGARALYLGSTLYRIHGTNQPHTIGGNVSSGCIRMRNEDVIDLYDRVPVGATVIVI